MLSPKDKADDDGKERKEGDEGVKVERDQSILTHVCLSVQSGAA